MVIKEQDHKNIIGLDLFVTSVEGVDEYIQSVVPPNGIYSLDELHSYKTKATIDIEYFFNTDLLLAV